MMALAEKVQRPRRQGNLILAPVTKLIAINTLLVFALIVKQNTVLLGAGVTLFLLLKPAGADLFKTLKTFAIALPFLLFAMGLQFWLGMEPAAILDSVALFGFSPVVGRIQNILILMSRFGVLLSAFTLFLTLTDPSEIYRGTETLLLPLKRFKVPVHDLAMIVTVTFRFIPLLRVEAEKIRRAQISRGGDFDSRYFNPVKKARTMIPLIVPLFLRSLYRGEVLIEAMTARNYGVSDHPTRLTRYPFRFADIMTLFLITASTAVLFYMSLFPVDFHFLKILWNL